MIYVLIKFIVDFYEQNSEHVCIVFERFLTYGLMKVAKSNRQILLEGNFRKVLRKDRLHSLERRMDSTCGNVK